VKNDRDAFGATHPIIRTSYPGALGAAMSMNNALFSDLIAAITERGRNLLTRRSPAQFSASQAAEVVALCDALLSGRGEASGIAIASEILRRYQSLSEADRLVLFEAFAHRFGADQDRLKETVEAWLANPSDMGTADLHFQSEPRRQELLRRLNRAPGGTRTLIEMRADLLALTRQHSELAAIDRDFMHLLASWFNRGFLVLRRIDWSTPAIVLEKIIRYEAVHEIHDWNDLRRRIDPIDRRCYGFFHPALSDEPLIFVEVALTEAIPPAIAPLLAEDRQPVALENARTAVFYSISNCQRGLARITFGNFLIKQVVEELRRELLKLESFVTLSPVPGFSEWMKTADDLPLTDEDHGQLGRLDEPGWHEDGANAEQLRRLVESCAAHYFLRAKRPDGRPIDPVARFHLGNGARLERINWLGDVSPKGLRDSAGMMVNYLYDLDHIEKNHEAYANQGEVAASNTVRRLLKSEQKPRFSLASASLSFG
jgi:malonyl-CoA decarboxylase